MNNTILSILRHALTFGGGVLASQGYVSADKATAIVSGLASLVGLIWGAVDEYLAEKKAKANAAQG